MTQVDPVPVDPLVGQTVAGKYKIVKQLGEGGMGCVYLAEQQLGSTARCFWPPLRGAPCRPARSKCCSAACWRC